MEKFIIVGLIVLSAIVGLSTSNKGIQAAVALVAIINAVALIKYLLNQKKKAGLSLGMTESEVIKALKTPNIEVKEKDCTYWIYRKSKNDSLLPDIGDTVAYFDKGVVVGFVNEIGQTNIEGTVKDTALIDNLVNKPEYSAPRA